MEAILRFFTIDNYQFEIKALFTTSGSPILPSKGDWISVDYETHSLSSKGDRASIDSRTYEVSNIVWYYNKREELDRVIAYCNEIRPPRKAERE